MKLFKNILLFLVATILFLVVFIIATIRELIVFFTYHKNDFIEMLRGFYIGMAYLFYSIALVIDKIAAMMFPSLWNALFIKGKYTIAFYFGSRIAIENKYSISKILGINYINHKEQMTKFAIWFKELLDLFEFEHIIKTTEK